MAKKRPGSRIKTDARELRELAGFIMRLPCNREKADKLWVYESQSIYAAYFREVSK